MGKKNVSSQLMESQSSAASQQTDIIELYYGATTDENIKNKQELGQPIEQDSISEIRLTETIFGTLPKLTIKLFDTGEWANTFAFRAGNNLRLRITPKNGNPDMLVPPYIDCFFTLEGVNYYIDSESAKYIYELSCIYNCEKYINQVCSWPETEVTAILKGYKKTSKEVLEEIIGQTSLKFDYKCSTEPTDKMLWLNKTLTYAKFAKHIMDHAWLGENDLPIMYINKNGKFAYDSLQRLKTQGIKYSYVYEESFINAKQKNIEENKNDIVVKPYDNILFYTVPYRAFDDGCTVQMSQYNPYNRSELDTEKQKPQKIQDEQENSYRQYEYNGNQLHMANVSNKSAKSINLLNKRQYCGIYFKDLHEYYNVAPLHHKNIRNSFFTNFCYISLDMNQQNDTKQNDVQVSNEDKKRAVSYINLGEKIHVDAGDALHQNPIMSGDFIVSGLTHVWAPNTNYTIVVQGVSDGTSQQGYTSYDNITEQATNTSKKSR